jgi:hypothetical protein
MWQLLLRFVLGLLLRLILLVLLAYGESGTSLLGTALAMWVAEKVVFAIDKNWWVMKAL